MIGGEKIALQLDIAEEETEMSIPAVLAALLEHNEHAKSQFYKLSRQDKLQLIENIRGTDEMDKQIGISLKLLNADK